jgi:pyrroloquinoline quinone (PQQ) biosynthesis protein C
MAWGPRLGTPLVPRILERIPEISFEMAVQLETECQKAQRLANDLCERTYAGELTQTQLQTMLLKEFPWIDAINSSHAYSQGMYCAWHG